jgi:leader peptidase (prepilin peptidase) / N-methyltransferase
VNDAAAPALEPVFVTLLGFFLGSFMNVCIYRLPRKLSPVRPRSGCPKCGHMLAWYENVPVLSYLFLRGKCRSCGTRISPMYPIIESITGAMFLAGYLWYGPSALLIVRLLFGCAMIVLFVIDLQHKILPNVITLPGIVVGLLLSEVAGPGWLASLIGLAVGAGSLFVIAEVYYRVRHEEGLGMGDVKMLGMIGAFLGWKLVLVTLVLSSVAGSLVGIGVLITKKESLKYALPFGTFLAVAAMVAAVAGDSLVNWYLQFYQ